MSKYSLAVKLADELGTSVSKASRLIDDVGFTQASRLVDEAAAGAGKASRLTTQLPTNWWKPTAAAGAVSGGVVGYKYLDTEKAREIADTAESESQKATTVADAVRAIMDDDSLTPEQRRELVQQFLAANKTSTPSQNGGSLIGGDVQTLVVLLIVLALVFNYALEGD